MIAIAIESLLDVAALIMLTMGLTLIVLATADCVKDRRARKRGRCNCDRDEG